MRLAKVIGTVTATVKDARLTGSPLMLCKIQKGGDFDSFSTIVAVDTVGSGVDDLVLVAEGSAARLAGQTSGAPVDATIVAVVDDVTQETLLSKIFKEK